MNCTRPMSTSRPAGDPVGALGRGLAFALRPSLFIILFSGCGPTSFLITPVPASLALVERVVVRESPWARQKVALIDVDGVLKNGRDRSLTGVLGENPVALFKEKLDRAACDRRVKAVVVRINSPGGTVTASDLMYTELRDFRRRTGKPVIASLLDVAASGGYYVACAADRIYGYPTTITGSIGVILITPEVTRGLEMLGVRVRTFKSGALKDAGSLFRPMTERDEELFQGMIAKMHERFLAVVREGRPELSDEQLNWLADGRVFLGPEAKEQGLIDEIGTMHDALEAAKTAAGLAGKNILVVQYARPLAHRPNVYAQGGELPAQVSLVSVALPDWLRSPAPQLLYLWAPGW